MSLLDALIEDDLWMPSRLSVTGEPRRETWICLRRDGGSQVKFGSGTRDDPYDGSTADKFDAIMSDLVPENALVRLGPGTFKTRGGSGNSHFPADGFEPKPGWRIVGAGMFQTTIKLVSAVGANQGIPIIGGGEVDGLEVSDLTLDCNIAGQANSSGYAYPRLMVQGIAVSGSNIAIRRVRCINWAFNNRKPDGTFVAAYNTATGLHLGELTTNVEDALLVI